MANVFASAGAAARAANDLNMLQMQARKMIRQENNLPNKVAKEKDLEYTRAQDLRTQEADTLSNQIKQGLMIARTLLGIGSMVAGAVAANKSKEEGATSAGNAEQVKQKDSMQKQMNFANYADLAMQSAGQVATLVQSFAELAKESKNRKTLAAEAGSADAAIQSLDSSGRA